MDEKSRCAILQLKKIGKLGNKMRLAAECWDSEWQTLIAIILSARTRDEVTIEVCKRLFIKYRSLKELAESDFNELSLLIKQVNFYKNKSRNILGCSRKLLSDFRGKVPHELNHLMALPGVGRKTANVFLAEYGHDNVGVDTHLAYCSRMLGWTNNKEPHKIEQDLLNLFPKKYWRRLNPLLVRFGKTYTSRKKKDDLLKNIRKFA